jgi:hypothetical protein
MPPYKDDGRIVRIIFLFYNSVQCLSFVVQIDLPASTEVWCMYHCAYSCPCHSYRNPLEYAPDRARNVAKRSIGGRFVTRKKSRLEEKDVKGDEGPVDNEAVEELIRQGFLVS